MKRLFTVVMLLLCLVTVQGQEDITRFLGIPVDGSKSEMVNLRRKALEAAALTAFWRENLMGRTSICI